MKSIPKRSILLGIVGDSASGKTTLSEGIAQILGPERVTVVSTDDYHKYNRHQRQEQRISALHPDCNYINIIEQHLNLIGRGQPILKPVYNHSTGDFDPPGYVEPREFVIVEGLLAFFTREMRDCFDVKVYLDPPEELRYHWKVKRDTVKRGYTLEQVVASLDKQKKDSQQFIWTQRRWADIVVRFYPPEGIEQDGDGSHLNARLVLRPTIPHPDMRRILEHGDYSDSPGMRLELGRDDVQPVDFLEIDGDIPLEKTRTLEDLLWHHIHPIRRLPPEQIGWYMNGTDQRRSNPLALTQLLIGYHMTRAHEELL
ncbi:MAG: phosphoribulokinase [Dehalococcoidia bacterium]